MGTCIDEIEEPEDMHAVSLLHSIRFGRKARDVIAVAISKGGDDKHFWEIIREEAIKRVPIPVAEITNIRPMKDEDAIRLSDENIGFGIHASCSFEKVYRDHNKYMQWLADNSIELLRWLAWRRKKL